MDTAAGLQPIAPNPIVHDRQGGQRRGDREAFQRALREQADSADSAKDEAPAEPEKATRSNSTQRSPERSEQPTHHVDVLA